MITKPTLVRTFDDYDYESIKKQAKEKHITLKDLAQKCGYKYNQFHRILKGLGDGTKVANDLLGMGFILEERTLGY